MAKKPTGPKVPSQQTIELVLTMAFNSPQANCGGAQQTIAAIQEVQEYFRPMFVPATPPIS